jgi:Ser/Thr protein kinase RdoA (MazF antagonist)
MKHRQTTAGELFQRVKVGEEDWRFVLFDWLEGEHLTHGSVTVAERFGRMARKINDLSSGYRSEIFPKESHVQGSEQFLIMIRNQWELTSLAPDSNYLLQHYVTLIQYHIDQARSDLLEFVIQSDLNPLNVLWNKNEEICGIVDFESITYTDRVEGLAWLIKWYSRTGGVGSHEMSPVLAETVLRGYGADNLLTRKELQRLPSLLWLSGCLNWNFTARTIELLKNGDDLQLQEQLRKYLKRGEKLVGLV